MTKKIVAIGGGENGRYLGNGKYREYETEPMDKEIIRLTGKENPNYLFMVHAQPFNNTIEEGYFETMKKIYGDMFGCNCRDLKSTELDDMEVVKEKIAWADIIYEGGGDTLEMINLWKKTGFDKVLLNAYNDGKVLCGVSAGAVCWFNSCNSDSVTSDNDVTFSSVDCLNFIDAYITPHTDENGRYESTKEEIKNKYNIELYDIENSKNDLEEITSRINEEKIKLNTLEVEEKSIVNKLEDLIKLEEEFATIHEQLKEIEQKNYEINLAKDFLEKAYEKMKKNITPKFTFNLSENIKNITNGKYTNINVNDENGLIVEIQNGEYIPAERLSIGTIDQLYLSLRISMIEEISKEKMPIILDEAFAYFDDERLENILKYLTQKYKQHQLIIFTCTNREKNILDKLNCIYNSVEL